jgi:flagellar biosynthesis protein FlhF
MSEPATKAGATYKFVVRTAEEAVQTIREKLGPDAKVLSVRQVQGQGIGGLFGKPKLEVIAQVGEAQAKPAREALGVSAEVAAPMGVAIAEPPSSLNAPAAETMAAPSRPARDKLPKLPELLRRSGFSETMLNRLQTTPAFAEAEQKPLHHALVEIGQQLRRQASSRRPRPLPARSAFLGTPGVGRTTALCKWLALEVFARQKVGRVLKAEFDRPNPGEGLAVFCEALGISVEYYAPEENAGPSTLGGSGEFLYADLPGLSLRSPAENASIASFLDREKFAGRVLVLNAAYDPAMLRRGYAAGTDLGATHVVFTHLDELEHWGKLWDFLLEGELTPLFLATGPSLTGDCEEEAVSAVLRKTIPGA